MKTKNAPVDIASDFEDYRANVVSFPGLETELANRLNRSVESIRILGVGYYPAKDAFVFPERNATGDLTGMTFRHRNGRKICAKGGKRGLFYEYNFNVTTAADSFTPGKVNWERVTTARPCPVCGRVKYCLLDKRDPDNPGVVLCTGTGKGSKRKAGNGWLHELKKGADRCGSIQSVLRATEKPIAIVEGASDVLAALDLGFEVAIGKPGNTSGNKNLRDMPLNGHTVYIFGEFDEHINKAGQVVFPGKEGMDRTFIALREKCTCVRVMPPKGIKDLRAWVDAGLTYEQLEEYVAEYGDSSTAMPKNLLEDDFPLNVAERLIQDQLTMDKFTTLRKYVGNWYLWTGSHYACHGKDHLRGEIYRYLDGKSVIRETPRGPEMVKFKVTARTVTDIVDALSKWDLTVYDAPKWLTSDVDHKRPEDLVTFKDGLLDLGQYADGNIRLLPHSPHYFNTLALPYEFDADAEYGRCEEYFNEVFNGAEDCVRLLRQWLGYCLVADTSMQKFMILIGPSRSGKGTILRLIERMLGQDQVCGITWHNLSSQFGREPMLGRSVALLGDARTPARNERAAILECLLRITGNDTISVNQKHVKERAAVRLRTRLTMAVNEFPAFIDNANALEARMLILDLPNSYAGKEDYTLETKLAEHVDNGGLARWALGGLMDLRTSGRFCEPATSAVSRKHFKALTAPIQTFIEECCDIGPDRVVPKSALFDVFCRWCHENQYSATKREQFGRAVTNQHRSITQRRGGAEVNRQREYVGIAINAWATARYLTGEL